MEPQIAQHKLRGAFFTPDEVCRFITDWAIRRKNDTILEPSCGEANFLVHSGNRLRALGTDSENLTGQLHGTELHEPSVKTALGILEKQGLSAQIESGDFFDTFPMPIYDAVVGNPPYIRYQHFTGKARAKSIAVALKYGVRLSGLASSWAAFVVYATQFLKPDGRLGLVLPAELLSVKYAAQVRRFLLNRFAKVQIVTFEELVFPGVLEDVVILLAEGDGTSDKFEVFQARNTRDLLYLRTNADVWTKFTPADDDKWTTALLSPESATLLQQYGEDRGFVQLADWGAIYLGAVTGNNKYFTLNRDQFALLGLRATDVLKISPPGSRHLRGLTFTAKAWKAMANDGQPCYLFHPNPQELNAASLQYIAQGEAQSVHTAYKCRVRSPWWRVPTVPKPDFFLTYMDHDRPRLIANEAGVYHLNSLYGVTLHETPNRVASECLPISSLNSLSLLSAEIVGRSYGGGMLKLEPREADNLVLPSKDVLRDAEKAFSLLKPQLAVALRSANLLKAVSLVDKVLLENYMGLKTNEISAIREAREFLFSRRVNRGRVRNGED